MFNLNIIRKLNYLRPNKSTVYWNLITLVVVLYIAIFSLSSCLTYLNGGTSAYDFGLHIQALWKISFFKGLFNTIRGLPIWGDHCWFIMVFIAPMYRVVPLPETLLIIQSLFLGASALVLMQFSVQLRNSFFASFCLACAWLISPALQNMNLENFHPESIQTFFIFAIISSAYAKRWKIYWPSVFLALCCKEDVSLTIFSIGLFLALRGEKKIGFSTALLSIIWFLACVKIILPMLNGQGFFRFSHGYWFSVFWENRFNFDYYYQSLFSAQVRSFYWKVGSPLLFLFLLSPTLSLCAVPSFLVLALSRNDYLLSIDYHYVATILPIIFASCACALKVIKERLPATHLSSTYLPCCLLLASIWANNSWSHLALFSMHKQVYDQVRYYKTSGVPERILRFKNHLPVYTDVPLAASHNLVPYVANRNEIFMFPNPWEINYWGINGENRVNPCRIQYLFLSGLTLDEKTKKLVENLIQSGEFGKTYEEAEFFIAKRLNGGCI